MRTQTTWRLPRRIATSGGEVAADVLGSGPPVVLVHGTPAWSYLWRTVAPALAEQHTVYVWDLLGFGDSRIDPGVAPSIDRQARTLAELVEHWGLDAPALVGHDIGGATVLRAHLIHRVPARRIALLDAAMVGEWLTPFTAHIRANPDTYRTMPPHVFADIIQPRMRTATHRAMPDDVAATYLEQWSGAAGQQRWIDQVAAVGPEDTRDLMSHLGDITAPTTVLWGAADQWMPVATGHHLATTIPGARWEPVADAGHFLPEDNPTAVTAALLAALT